MIYDGHKTDKNRRGKNFPGAQKKKKNKGNAMITAWVYGKEVSRLFPDNAF